MRLDRVLIFAMTMCAVLGTTVSKVRGEGSADSSIKVNAQHEVRYTSGNTIYVERLMEDRWVGRYWTADGRIDGTTSFWDGGEAFEIRIKEEPTPPTVPGTLLSRGWEWVSGSELPGTDGEARHFVVSLSNKLHPVTVKVHTLLDGTPVLTRWLEITNTSRKSFALTELSPWSGRLWSGTAPITLGHALRWEIGWEGWFGWTPLKPGINVFKNDKGLVADDPYFVLRNESNGEYFFGQLAWPASYTMEFQKENGLSFKVGPIAFNALRVIAPAETITTPAVHLGPVKGDFDAAVQAMHEHIRRSVLPKTKPEKSYLVQYLFPEDQWLSVYRGDDYNETNVKKCMDVAAAAGIEVFIVDGPTWATGFGNWLVPKADRFPRGLGPLVEYAHQKGMLFGLYAEPEGGRGDWSKSKGYREHFDWFVWPGNVLNLTLAEAAAYMESELTHIIDHYKLDLYRHDFNAPIRGRGSETLREGFLESDYWRHYEVFYAITERVHANYPDLILQQASAGGTRLELATIGRWPESFTTDRAAMPLVFRMSSGVSVYLPPEVLVTPNGMKRPKPDLETTLRGAYALGNTPMIFNAVLPKDLGELTPELREKFLHHANLYKTFIRPLLATCKVYHHAPVNATGGVESGDWFAMEFTSPDRQRGWATIVHLSSAGSDTYVFRPRGLDGRKKYSVTFDNTGKTETFEGSRLMRDGLPIRPETHPGSELLLFEAR